MCLGESEIMGMAGHIHTNDKNRSKNGKRMLSGVAVLSASTVIVKIVGALFKIPMIKYVGIEGMGYFNAAYHFYVMLMTISTSGLPVALSILISRKAAIKDNVGAARIYRAACVVFCTLGGVFSLLMLMLSGRIAILLGIKNAKYCLMAVSPAVLFVSISGAVRGYFQGFGIMTHTAISQVIESVGKLIFGLCFAFVGIKQEREAYIVAAYAIFGLTLGIILSALYLLAAKFIYAKKHKIAFECEKLNIEDISSLIATALPITLASAILSLISLLDTMLIPNMLIRSGVDEHTALTLYSTYTNLALPIFALPSAFISSVALVIVPAASSASVDENDGRKKLSEVTELSMKLCGMMTLPCAFGIAVLAYPMLALVFSSETLMISIASRLLVLLSPSVFFSGMLTVTNSMLQSCSRQKVPITSLAIGGTLKLICEVLFVSESKIGIYGAPISTLVCSLTVVTINICSIAKLGGYSISPIRQFVPTMIASALCGMGAEVSYLVLSGHTKSFVSLFCSVMTGGMIYIASLILFGVLKTEEIKLFPLGNKIYKRLEAFKR